MVSSMAGVSSKAGSMAAGSALATGTVTSPAHKGMVSSNSSSSHLDNSSASLQVAMATRHDQKTKYSADHHDVIGDSLVPAGWCMQRLMQDNSRMQGATWAPMLNTNVLGAKVLLGVRLFSGNTATKRARLVRVGG